MHTLTLFGMEILISLALSLIVVSYLRDVLEAVFAEACPPAGGAFWIKTLSLLQFMVPLLLVVWRADLSLNQSHPALELKHALLWMLLGHCGALVFLAINVWHFLVLPALPGKEAHA